MKSEQESAKQAIFDFLAEKKIPYRAFSHEKTDLLSEKLEHDAAAGVFGATHCKNLVLANRQKTRFYLLTMAFGKRFRTGPVSRGMGSGRLNFAEDEILSRYLRTTPGMVSPLELIFDEERVLNFFLDEDLKSAERLCFHPSDDTVTVVIEREDFFNRLLPAMGITPQFVTIPSEERESEEQNER